MKRILLATLVAGLPMTALADGFNIHPTLPGTSARDYSAPGARVERNLDGSTSIYPTLPGTNARDYSAPGARIEKGYGGRTTIYKTLPGTNVRDYSAPGWTTGR